MPGEVILIPRVLRFIQLESSMEALLVRVLTDDERQEIAEHCGLAISPTRRKPMGSESAGSGAKRAASA